MPTFQLNNVKPTDYKPATINMKQHLERRKVITQNEGKIMMFTQPQNPVNPSFSNGFVGACYKAYSHHHHLVLRPDDVWLCIVLTFANYVDKHAEEMRKCFVEHDGKKQLNVEGGGCVYSADWDSLIDQMCQEIDKNTKSEITEWLVPNFSTTTQKDKVIGGVVLMGAMKHYFEYGISLCCGLPSITLEGTLNDWVQIRKRADKILNYAQGGPNWTPQPDLGKWHTILCPVLDQFIETYKGNVDKKFWNSICDWQGGSGTSDLSGWLLAFVPFNEGRYHLNHPVEIIKTGKYGQIDTDYLETSSVVEVPVNINDNGREYKTIFYAGAIVSQYDHQQDKIAPSFDWVMIDVTNSSKSSNDCTDDQYQSQKIQETKWDGPEYDNLPTVHSHKVYYVDNLKRHRCDICHKSPIKTSYRCFDCDFDCCLECYDRYKKHAKYLEDLSCRFNQLTLNTNAIKYQSEKLHEHTMYFITELNNHNCDVCSKPNLIQSYRCNQCDFDCCLQCFSQSTIA